MYNSCLLNLSPDANEHKTLKKYYFKLSFIIIALIVVFSFINRLVFNISAGIMGNGFSKEAIDAGKNIIRADPVLKAIYSYGFPIIADIAALGTGLVVTGANLKKKITFKGFNGKDMMSFLSFTFGFSTVGSIVNLLIIVLIAALSGKLSDFSADSAARIISTKGNPVWLDILIYTYVCLLGPVLEELIFRGVLLEGLRKYGNLFGIVMSSVLFGLMHQNIIQCIPAMCIGFVFAVMTVKSGSLIPAIFAHILNNSLSAMLNILMNTTDLKALLDTNDITALYQQLSELAPMLIMSYANVIMRFVCIIASVILVFRFRSSKKRLFEHSEYCAKRTWKYIFTSVPWLLAMAYMLFETVTSLSL